MNPELVQSIRRIATQLEEAIAGQQLTGYAQVPEVSDELARLIETHTGSKLADIVEDPNDPRQLEMALAELHREVSGARKVSLHAGPTGMVLEVQGCPNFSKCSSGSDPTFCMPDLVVAAVIQKTMQTPVGLGVMRDELGCTHEYKPAWLAHLLSEIEVDGAEGMLVLHGDRIVFSHVPSDQHAAALSEGLLIKEEGELREDSYHMQDYKIMMMTLGSVFVSVCLKPEGADEPRIREKVRVAFEASA